MPEDTSALEAKAVEEILGPPQDSSVESTIDLLDSEILRIEEVLRWLNEKAGKRAYLEGFRQEIIERFGLAGFYVEVKVYEGMGGEWYAFNIIINGRVEGEFDHDRQVHEVTNDILDLGTKGVIKTNGLIVE